jgi:two-component system, cell cycle sensor histidine kinase and response regulator CckA
MMEESGYDVVSAGSGDEALRLAADGRHLDVLVTDAVMPGMTGLELARRLVALRPGLKVLFVSGYAADVLAERQAVLPDSGFLAKPFTLDQLGRKLREVVEGEPGRDRG